MSPVTIATCRFLPVLYGGTQLQLTHTLIILHYKPILQAIDYL